MCFASAAGTVTVTGSWLTFRVSVREKPLSAVITNGALEVLRLISLRVTLPSQSDRASTTGLATQVPEPPLYHADCGLPGTAVEREPSPFALPTLRSL